MIFVIIIVQLHVQNAGKVQLNFESNSMVSVVQLTSGIEIMTSENGFSDLRAMLCKWQ